MTDTLRSLHIAGLSPSGDQTSPALFQTNVIQSSNTGAPWFSDDPANPLGNPTTATQAALDHFAITMIRFPGGETNAVFQDGMMTDGALPDHILALMTYASAANIAVNMVVPVETPATLGRAVFLDQMQDFAAALHQQFPGVVQSFELGNEYWGGRVAFDDSLELAYGQNAGEVAVALAAGMQTAGYDADVFLQASGNLRGAYGNDPDRANAIIQAGVAQVTDAIAALDGIIRNSYWKDPDLNGFENSTGVFAEDRGLEQNLTGTDQMWETWAGRPLLTRVGEYNINKNIALGNDGVDIGVHGASYLLEHVTNMIEAGVDQAFLWPISHNTQNAMLHRDEQISTQTVHGIEIATNTTRAAMLDLMRQTVASHDLIRADWTLTGDDATPGSDVELTLFEATDKAASQGDLVAFLSSRSAQDMTLEVDLSDFVAAFDSLRITSIYYSDTGGNLRDAVVTEITPDQIGDGAQFGLTLRPYEVVQFAFDTAPNPEEAPELAPEIDLGADTMFFDPGFAFGTDAAFPQLQSKTGVTPDQDLGSWDGSLDALLNGVLDNNLDSVIKASWDTARDAAWDAPSDPVAGSNEAATIAPSTAPLRIQGEDAAEIIMGGAGNDTIFARAGDDYIDAGAGDNFVRGGHGNDQIFSGTGRGDDTIHGDLGHDVIMAGGGADLVDGGFGHDMLNGGAGTDTLTGGHGNDLFIHSDLDRGFDLIRDFEIGQDRLLLEDPSLPGPDTIRLLAYMHQDTPSTLIRFLDDAGNIDTARGGVVLHGVARPDFDIDHIEFAYQSLSLSTDAAPAMAADTILPGYEGLDDIQSLLLPYTGAPDTPPDPDLLDDPIWTVAA